MTTYELIIKQLETCTELNRPASIRAAEMYQGSLQQKLADAIIANRLEESEGCIQVLKQLNAAIKDAQTIEDTL